MAAQLIKKSKAKFLVIGPMYNKFDKLLNSIIKEKLFEYDFIIINGGLSYPDYQLDYIDNTIKMFDNLNSSHKIIYNLSNYDLELIKELEIDNRYYHVLQWLSCNSNVVIIEFDNQFYIITNGGVTNSINKKSLTDNLETSFVSFINNKPWHEYYGGGFGYIISNLPLTNQEPIFYNYSLQMGNSYSKEGFNVYAQEIDQFGLKKTILLPQY